MSDLKVGDIVIEQHQERRQPTEYTPRRVIKVGRKYFYLDFGNQHWRNGIQYRLEDGVVNNFGYASNTRVFKTIDDLRKHLIPGVAIPELAKKGLEFKYEFNANNNGELLLKLCEVLGCDEPVVKRLDKVLDNVRTTMLELEQEQMR
jgi:hypothetical protein